MLRLTSFFPAAAVSIGGFLFIDYTLASRWAGNGYGAGLTAGEYLDGLAGRMSGADAAAIGGDGLPTTLAAMMPKAPDGWTVRHAVPEDTAPFLAKRPTDETAAAGETVASLAVDRSGEGLDQVALTYEKGERRVIIQAVRFPDRIFTSSMTIQQRLQLQTPGAEVQPTPFMTVRGLDVTEDLLPKAMRARLFLADVGAQIRIRVAASHRMTDEELLPFFQTLHVKAMNASVVDRQAGLGDVPVIVLASALDPTTREFYEADRTARAAAEAAERKAEAPAEGG